MVLHSQDLTHRWLPGDLAPVSLRDLNDRASMMSRMDNKYIIGMPALQTVIPKLAEHYDVLEIDGRRAFTYATRYFDDADRSAYFQHHQGLRKGFKVRVRQYVEAGLCYLEVKVKGRRGMTIKHRMPYDRGQIGALTEDAKEFARSIYSGHYGKQFDYNLDRALDIRYRRITLVAKEGGDRMTIDTDLNFRSVSQSVDAGTEVFIVETKSRNGRGYADRCMRAIGQRSTKRCSKYCVGMAVVGEVSRFNRFLPTMRKLGLADTARSLQHQVRFAAE